MYKTTLKITFGILLLITLLEIIYFILIRSKTTFVYKFVDIEPRFPVESSTMVGTLKYIRDEVDPNIGHQICFDYKETPAPFCLSEKDPNTSFYMSENGNKNKITYTQLKKMIEAGSIKAGYKSEYIYNRQKTMIEGREVPILEQLTVYK